MQRRFIGNEHSSSGVNKNSPPSSPNPSSSSSSSSNTSSSDSGSGSNPWRFNHQIPPFSRFVSDDFLGETPKTVEYGERVTNGYEFGDRRKLLRSSVPIPSLNSVSSAIGNAFPMMNNAQSNPVIQSQQSGFNGSRSEVTNLTRLTNSWAPRPVENPYQFQYIPYNHVSSEGTPSLKRKSEFSANSCYPTHMETLFGQLPVGASQDPVLHTGYVPVQTLFQNTFIPISARSIPSNYSLTPPIKNEASDCRELNNFATSQSRWDGNSVGGNASVPRHQGKMAHPASSINNGMAIGLDVNRYANLEPSAGNGYPLAPQNTPSEVVSNVRPVWIPTETESCIRSLPPASSYSPEYDKEIEGKGLVLLVQKELRKTDVGNLGRIVIPKREAETNLPPLEAKDGLILQMDDLNYSVEWKFKYRFWPNNKSRMYVMENTGDFVKMHNLKTGDLFMIYKEKTSGKYVVRGKKGNNPLYIGNMVGNNAIEGETVTAIGQLGSEQRNTMPVDFFRDVRTEQGTIRSGISFDISADTCGPSPFQFTR